MHTVVKLVKNTLNTNKVFKTVHENVKPYNCHSCGKCFGEKGYLNSHLRVVHGNVKSFQCNSCDKRFGQSSTLKHHFRIVHGNTKS